MKKYLILPAAILLTISLTLMLADFSAAKTREKAMAGVIRLHVRAADNSEEEQSLKLKVRDKILNYTQTLLRGCADQAQAKELLTDRLSEMASVGEEAVTAEGKTHPVTVSLQRETFEYREYDGFFLPEGEYDSLIVEIGSGEGANWWCVIFPAACYVGGAEKIETDSEKMPTCFQLAKTKNNDVTVKWWLWARIKEWFSQ